MSASGGYVIHARDFIRHGNHAHTSAMERPISQFDIEALNAVQATGWRINRRVFDTMLEAWNSQLQIAGLYRATEVELPKRFGDEVWNAMLPEAQKEHKKLLGKLHSANMSAASRKNAILDCLNVANELRDYPAIWYPHSRCFRGRLHPIPTSGPMPQGNDISRALIEFSKSYPLSFDGFSWLCIRMANCSGHDKLSLTARELWTLDHMDLIVATAADPLGNLWWAEVNAEGEDVLDEPWQALATIFELAEAHALADPTTYLSHLPVPQDGSCNGIQHLSGMGLDPKGAFATNMTSEPHRQDIYMEVVKAVIAIVDQDVADGHDIAPLWVGKVKRATVKRAVMTTPYGVTAGGIKKQLLSDGLVPECNDQSAAAGYLRDCMVTALDEIVVSAKIIMGWLQSVAEALAEANLPFEFRTPTGSLVRQAYHEVNSLQVQTLCGRVRVEWENTRGPLKPSKCALAAAPNTIHAFDASHLAATVHQAVQEGVESFAMIHDNYGTHAGLTTRLGVILRETFVNIYSVDHLAKIAAYVENYAPGVELPRVPVRGSFDISQVLQAPLFFS